MIECGSCGYGYQLIILFSLSLFACYEAYATKKKGALITLFYVFNSCFPKSPHLFIMHACIVQYLPLAPLAYTTSVFFG